MQQFALLYGLVTMQSLIALVDGDRINIDIELVEAGLCGDGEVAYRAK